MPDKQLTIATYAAGASLAAITLVYVFAPTFFIDGEGGGDGGAKGKNRSAVGLSNSANDCFINSVLQALAGLGDLRTYLIREIHRRALDGAVVYENLVEDPARKSLPAWKLNGLQRGIVTQGLKDMLDSLNERPLYRKTISAAPFVGALEDAFRQRISRQQQDAQEFLQVVAERLCDEYHAGRRARREARRKARLEPRRNSTVPLDEKTLDQELSKLVEPSGINGMGLGIALPGQLGSDQTDTEASDNVVIRPSNEPQLENGNNVSQSPGSEPEPGKKPQSDSDLLDDDEEQGFPFEGQSESQIECLTCGFKPKPSQTTFCTITLNVPQVSSTSLSSCFDGMFKTEYIEDFKCEKCRLVHAMQILSQELLKSNSENFKAKAIEDLKKLEKAIDINPEETPKGVELPDSKFAPKRKIARHVKVTVFPKVMAIHLSRSIFDVNRSSMKNSAKVAFPERLPLGGLLAQKKYKLLGVVTHKGSHHSGHYESFRRQNIYAPFSTPNAFEKTGAYSKSATPVLSLSSTPRIDAVNPQDEVSTFPTPQVMSPTSLSAASSRVSLSTSDQSRGSIDSLSSPSLANIRSKSNGAGSGPTSAPREIDTSSIRSVARSARSSVSKVPSAISNSLTRGSSARSASASSNASPPQRKQGESLNPIEKDTPNSLDGQERSKTPLLKVPRRKKQVVDRWWRISDDKVKEATTSQVLAMQREVYLLFYELERDMDSV